MYHSKIPYGRRKVLELFERKEMVNGGGIKTLELHLHKFKYLAQSSMAGCIIDTSNSDDDGRVAW